MSTEAPEHSPRAIVNALHKTIAALPDDAKARLAAEFVKRNWASIRPEDITANGFPPYPQLDEIMRAVEAIERGDETLPEPHPMREVGDEVFAKSGPQILKRIHGLRDASGYADNEYRALLWYATEGRASSSKDVSAADLEAVENAFAQADVGVLVQLRSADGKVAWGRCAGSLIHWPEWCAERNTNPAAVLEVARKLGEAKGIAVQNLSTFDDRVLVELEKCTFGEHYDPPPLAGGFVTRADVAEMLQLLASTITDQVDRFDVQQDINAWLNK